MSKRTRLAISVLPAVAALGIAVPAVADGHGDVSEFYKGKTVTVMVPSGLGATLGLYGRLTTEHLGKHIPGNPTVIIQSRPGGGGTKGAAYAYNAAPKDGTYIAEALAPSVLAPLLRKMKFDASKFQWLGSIAPRPAVISVWHKSPVKNLEEARKIEAIMGSTGLGSETYLAPTLLNHIAGTKFKIVKGYKGGAKINKAMEGGEVHGRMNYWSGWTAGKPGWLKEKKLHHIATYGGDIPELKDIPSLGSLAKNAEETAMVKFLEVAPRIGMGFWVHEDVPKKRVAALRKAFMAMLNDPAFLADAKKRKAPVTPVAGETLDKLVAEAYATPPATIAKLKRVFGFK
jgi:tripartite-type tricarboxylate transporter receptor subunit TctC